MMFCYSTILLLYRSYSMFFRGSLIEFLIDKKPASHNRQFQAALYFVTDSYNWGFRLIRGQRITQEHTHSFGEQLQLVASSRIVRLLETGEKTGRPSMT